MKLIKHNTIVWRTTHQRWVVYLKSKGYLDGICHRYYFTHATHAILRNRRISIVYTLAFIKNNPWIVSSYELDRIRLLSTHVPTSAEAPLSKGGRTVTYDLVNETVANQGFAITEDKLNELLEIQPVSFPLPIPDTVYPAYVTLVGKPSSKNARAGVYIFTHIKTGQRYVGSSNHLARRFKEHWQWKSEDSLKVSGLLIPLALKDGWSAFRVDIFVIPSGNDNQSHMFLEQYHLLTGGFELNTYEIVSFNLGQGEPVYIYDKDKKELYFQAISHLATWEKTSIHVNSVKKYLNKDKLFLNTFAITDYLIDDAKISKLTISQFKKLLEEKRELFKKSSLRPSAVPVSLRNAETGDIMEFANKAQAVRYLIRKGYNADSAVLTKKLDINKVYKGHYCTKIQDVVKFKMDASNKVRVNTKSPDAKQDKKK